MAPSEDLTDFRLDPTSVRVLAHPLRSRLLTALRQDGPATATDLAQRLHTNTGATSYHLRRLESVGLVTDTEEGVGKRRLWRASTTSHSWRPSDFAGDPDAQTAHGWLVRDYAHLAAARFDHWLDVESTWPDEWRDAASLSDLTVTVTPGQLIALTEELIEVLQRHRDAGADDPRARRVSIAFTTSPIDLDEVPEPT